MHLNSKFSLCNILPFVRQWRNRHKLITCTQEPLQSIDNYMQELQLVAKTCNFEAVTADENKQQYIRDAFINGITSSAICQRLLENHTLAMSQAFNQARTLEQAGKQSASEEVSFTLAAALKKVFSNRSKDEQEKCFFCGNVRHPRSNCPARIRSQTPCCRKGSSCDC